MQIQYINKKKNSYNGPPRDFEDNKKILEITIKEFEVVEKIPFFKIIIEKLTNSD